MYCTAFLHTPSCFEAIFKDVRYLPSFETFLEVDVFKI
jgi:hypothetical protein